LLIIDALQLSVRQHLLLDEFFVGWNDALDHFIFGSSRLLNLWWCFWLSNCEFFKCLLFFKHYCFLFWIVIDEKVIANRSQYLFGNESWIY